jgi:hypothetical protein
MTTLLILAGLALLEALAYGSLPCPTTLECHYWHRREIMSEMFGPDDSIHSYTRAQALADGVLVDVSSVAREAGIRHPVALTRAVWERCVRVPPGVVFQDESGRLWDMVWMLRHALGNAKGGRIAFALHVRNDNRDRTPPLVRLKALCGPGDHGEPVITVLMPDED